MELTITKEMIEGMRCAADALRNYATMLEGETESKGDNYVGKILRNKIEQSRQQADMFDGFVRRTAWPAEGKNDGVSK
jgi:hypothetical protein